jgi:hypothetical protein
MVIFELPVDLAATVAAAADALGQADPTARAAAVAASMNALDGALSQVASARADQGIRADRLDKIREALAQSGLQLEEQKVRDRGRRHRRSDRPNSIQGSEPEGGPGDLRSSEPHEPV